MKKIKFCMQHPKVKCLNDAIKYLRLEKLQEDFEFIYDEVSPDYVIYTEHIYFSKKYKDLYFKYSNINPIRIYFGRELYMPDFNLFDYATSFYDEIICEDRYTPLSSAEDQYYDWIKDIKNNVTTIEAAKNCLNKKTGFCNFLYSNRNAHPMRDACFYELSQYKKVDSLGKWLNNVHSKGTGYEGHKYDSIDLKSNYKFSIAFENAVASGYNTEKILTSLQAHTVPLYFGDPNIEKYINPECFINCNKLSLAEIKKIVMDIDNNDEIWCKIVSSPWQIETQKSFKSKKDEAYLNFWRNIFSQEKEDAYRIAKGYHPDNYIKWFRKSKPIFDVSIFIKVLRKLGIIDFLSSFKINKFNV